MAWSHDREKRKQDALHYGSPEYKRNRPVVMRRDKWRCQIQTPGICAGAASTCDHIIPVAEGGSHKLDNLRAACGPCHGRKTAGEGGGYRNSPAPDPSPRPRTAW